MRIGLIVTACLLLGAIVWLVLGPPLPAQTSFSRLPGGGEFTLQSADGPVSLKDFRGKVVVVYFGYTFCPDICPTSLTSHVVGYHQLSPREQDQVALIFISVDPARDTPAHLKTYVQFFEPRMIGLTGDAKTIAAVAAGYGVFYAKQPAIGESKDYAVDHSALTYVVDRDGRLGATLVHGTPPEQVAATLRRFIQGKEGS